MVLIKLNRTQKAFNCRKLNKEDGGKVIVCEPVEILPDGRERPIGKEPVKFKIEGKIPVLEDDGGIDRQTLKELDEYLERFIR